MINNQFKPTVEKWSGNTTPLLRTKCKLCLTKPIILKKQKLNDQMSTWASGKLALTQLQETQYTQQHQL
ncbi:Uncharacterized protein FWK35_00022638 [Aphis craccivora]|uniref:Uncharacterized protein n=1 Tax=Aphis craccivora TaxID=307492 RepID=A0A6G0W1D3_APHCR|nr:Uncharacterized protein FWK35_00022638 [Aphis craccivora]